MYPILVSLLIFVVVAGATWWFGLWSNLITLVNLLLAASIASSIYEPVSFAITSSQRSFVYLADFIAVWLCFALCFIVLRGITDSLSGYRLKFNTIVEMTGRSVLSIWIACVFVCFSMFTVQLAPLPEGFYGDRKYQAQGTIPDRAWLAFIQSRSRGAFSSSQSSNFLFEEYVLEDHPDDVDLNCRVFDPRGRFLDTAASRRFAISLNPALRVTPSANSR